MCVFCLEWNKCFGKAFFFFLIRQTRLKAQITLSFLCVRMPSYLLVHDLLQKALVLLTMHSTVAKIAGCKGLRFGI